MANWTTIRNVTCCNIQKTFNSIQCSITSAQRASEKERNNRIKFVKSHAIPIESQYYLAFRNSAQGIGLMSAYGRWRVKKVAVLEGMVTSEAMWWSEMTWFSQHELSIINTWITEHCLYKTIRKKAIYIMLHRFILVVFVRSWSRKKNNPPIDRSRPAAREMRGAPRVYRQPQNPAGVHLVGGWPTSVKHKPSKSIQNL